MDRRAARADGLRRRRLRRGRHAPRHLAARARRRRAGRRRGDHRRHDPQRRAGCHRRSTSPACRWASPSAPPSASPTRGAPPAPTARGTATLAGVAPGITGLAVSAAKKLAGTVTTGGFVSTVKAQYGLDTAHLTTTAATSLPAVPGAAAVTIPFGALAAGRTYRARMIAQNGVRHHDLRLADVHDAGHAPRRRRRSRRSAARPASARRSPAPPARGQAAPAPTLLVRAGGSAAKVSKTQKKSKLKLTSAMLGKTVSCVVTAKNPAAAVTVRSAAVTVRRTDNLCGVPLDEYRERRDFTTTPEPDGATPAPADAAPVRDPGAPRDRAALGPAPRARRRARLVGAAEGHPARSAPEPARRPHRGPPAGVPGVRRRDPARRVRRRPDGHLGRGHVRRRRSSATTR